MLYEVITLPAVVVPGYGKLLVGCRCNRPVGKPSQVALANKHFGIIYYIALNRIGQQGIFYVVARSQVKGTLA